MFSHVLTGEELIFAIDIDICPKQIYSIDGHMPKTLREFPPTFSLLGMLALGQVRGATGKNRDLAFLERRMNMPRLNGTGPNGMGPLTGRGMGNCTDARGAGLGGGLGLGLGAGLGRGAGLGLGRGARRGGGRRFFGLAAPIAPDADFLDEDEEKALLNLEATRLEAQLGRIRSRLDGMGKKD